MLEVAFPDLAVALEPDVELLQRCRLQGVDAALSVHADVYESGVAENAKVFRDLGLSEAEAMNHIVDRARSVAQEFDDLEAMGFGEGFESFEHDVFNML